MPTVSIIVPVYQVEQYLPACVDSILAQTFSDFELILVDDGSPDKCGGMCDEYAVKDPRIRVIHQKNGGLSAARNAGMKIASGAFVSFIDGDDFISPVYLDSLYRAICRSGAAISVCHNCVFPDGKTPKVAGNDQDRAPVLYSGREATIKLYRGDPDVPVNACGKLFARTLIGDMRFPVGRLHEDQAFVPIACYRAQTVAAIRAPLYYYRDRPDSITMKKFTIQRYDDIWAVDQCVSFFEERQEHEIVCAAKEKRQRLLCVYAIYAKRDRIDVPREYRVHTWRALSYLKKHSSDDRYAYYLAQIHPELVRPHAYLVKLKRMASRKQPS